MTADEFQIEVEDTVQEFVDDRDSDDKNVYDWMDELIHYLVKRYTRPG